MKNFLLLLLGAFLTCTSALAQTDEGSWKVVANVYDPSGIEPVEYEMIETDVTKTGAKSKVYYATVDLFVFPDHPNPKTSKYQYVVTYTDKDGNVTKGNTPMIYQPIADGNIKVTISAWLNEKGQIATYASTSDYVICDSNWTGISYLAKSKDGENQLTYFNVRENNVIKAIRNIDLKNSTTQFLAGGSTSPSANTACSQGINKAEFDYKTSTVTVSKVSEMPIYVENYLPFVATVDITLPEGLDAYKFGRYDDQTSTLHVDLIESRTIEANTPIILKSDTPKEYVLSLGNDFKGIASPLDKRTIIEDVHADESILYGAHYPHLLTTTHYIFDGEKFVPAVDKSIITPFSCYLNMEKYAETPESVQIAFPEQPEPTDPDMLYVHFTDSEGNYLSTYVNKYVGEGPYSCLTKQSDGSYALSWIEFTENPTYFVLSSSNDFSAAPETEASLLADESKSWANFNGEVYHQGEVVNPSSGNVVPFSHSSGQFAISFNPSVIGSEGYAIPTFGEPVSTGVEYIEDRNPQDDVIYNIYGMPVDESYKGIVIKNGKKFILR